MIILTSNGLSSKALTDKTKSLLKNAERAVIITTASVEYKENNRHVPRLKNELEQLGLCVDFFDFDFQSPEDLLAYDVIEIIGGNPFYLLKSIRSANSENVMEALAETKIVIGISAGALVLQKDIELVAEYTPEANDCVGLNDLRGLALTDLEILPHYSRFVSEFERFEEKARCYETTRGRQVIRLNDGEAVFDFGNGIIEICK